MPSKMISEELANKPKDTAIAATPKEAAMDRRSTPCSVLELKVCGWSKLASVGRRRGRPEARCQAAPFFTEYL